jgi:hypothetical protein
MITDNNKITGGKAGSALRPVWDGLSKAARQTPYRMPAGGWFKEIVTSENWRTTTIIQRHRDQAAMTRIS